MASGARRGHLGWIAAAAALSVQWLALRGGGVPLASPLEALASGAAIFGAAFLLSWAAELAQIDVPRGLAIAVLAVIAVLPEYAVDIYLAWQAGRHPEYVGYATANMTGANRLLVGVGWAALVLVLWARSRGRERLIRLEGRQRLEVRVLGLATLYAFVIPAKRTLSLVDSVVLLALVGVYFAALLRQPVQAPHLVGPPLAVARLDPRARRLATAVMGLFAAATILLAAEPFAESLIATGAHLQVPEYLLIQWLAPLASETPEFVVALLFVVRGASATGMAALLSSKVTQWTLLVGALPVAYGLARGEVGAMPLDPTQVSEILLTAAQSALGVLILSPLALSLGHGALLLVLFVAQVSLHVLPHVVPALADMAWLATASADVFSAVYLLGILGLILFRPGCRAGLVRLVHGRGLRALEPARPVHAPAARSRRARSG